MCYRQFRRYGYILILCFFISILVVMRKLDPDEDNGILYEEVPAREMQFSKDQENRCGVNITALSNNTDFPECVDRLRWLQSNWRSHKCYNEYGVDGTLCSFYNYMARREHYCPIPSDWTEDYFPGLQEVGVEKHPQISHLFSLMNDSEENYEFIKSRIDRLWDKWREARRELVKKKADVETRKVKNTFLYLGFLNREGGKMSFAKASKSGGPLGELVQWSDLVASVYSLGHNIQMYTTWSSAKKALLQYKQASIPCPVNGRASIDLIFTDIIGLQKIRKQLKSFYIDNWCRFRVLDSFGTHAEFNQPQYFRDNYKKYGAKLKSNPWGANALNLQQFLTLYPHTDDNTFLGFVVETHPVNDGIKRENITVVYGKEAYMWENSSKILEVAARYTQIHATVENYTSAAGYAHLEFVNHGLLSARDFNYLLQKAKVFLGLGFPLEGPAPLEAVANGAIFIQPRFDPPKSRTTYKFFSEKPTMRKITSQNPYMERFVGYPYVFTVNVNDQEELSKAYEQALQLNPTSVLLYEFSFLGMLERVDVILTHLNFCAKNTNWPPFDKVGHIVLGVKGQSCQDACSENGFLCERSFFSRINNEETLQRYGCIDIQRLAEPIAPSLCSLQTDPYLFSCATEPTSDIRRLCPCRSFEKQQTILCEGC